MGRDLDSFFGDFPGISASDPSSSYILAGKFENVFCAFAFFSLYFVIGFSTKPITCLGELPPQKEPKYSVFFRVLSVCCSFVFDKSRIALSSSLVLDESENQMGDFIRKIREENTRLRRNF